MNIYKFSIILFWFQYNSCSDVALKFNDSFVIAKRFRTVFNDVPFAGIFNIPYARPPINELRFKWRFLYQKLRDKYDSHLKAPIPQSDWLIRDTINEYNNEARSSTLFAEDCLYLSIFMPFTSNTKPVLVWLHESSLWHDPDFFIEEEIIVVTVSFRTGIFGFLNTEDDFAEGNMGAKDILTALNWLKNNISLFNGDPSRITVAGAGMAVASLASMLLAPSAKGMFTRAIVLSGSALSPSIYKSFNFEIANKLYSKLKDPLKKFNRKELYEVLANGSMDELLSASQELFDSTEVRDNQRLISPFDCSLEIGSPEPFMKLTPIEMYIRQAVNNVPLLIGYTSLQSLRKLKGIMSNRRLLKYLNYNFQYLLPFEGKVDEYNSERYREIKQRIKDFYFVNGTITVRSLRRYAKYLSDIEIFPLLRQAVLQSDVSSCPVYLYRFAFKGSLNIGWRNFVSNLNWAGASLDDEICYLFRCKSLNHVYSSMESDERDFIKKIVRLLANFIKHGNPTPYKDDDILGNLHWTSLNETNNLKAMNFGKKIKMRDVPEEARMRFWYQIKEDLFT